MSYYNLATSDYVEGPAGTPGWADAPVPGWGINPFRAGPVRVGVGEFYLPNGGPGDPVLPRYTQLSGCGCPVPLGGLGAIESDAYRETTWGHVAFAAAGGIAAGLLMGMAWWRGPKR